AVLDSFRFHEGHRPPDAGEYRVIVAENADRPDSAVWTAPGNTPLSEAERAALVHADSARRHPGAIARMVRSAGSITQLAGNPAFFHYNRVDGAYLGAAHEWRATPRLFVTTKLGYGLGSEIWQYRLGGQAFLEGSNRLWAGAWYHDETVSRPTLISGGYNPTFRALFTRTDPLDYYRERGLTLSVGTHLLDFTRFDLRYDDVQQSTLDTVPRFFSGPSRSPHRDNPPIVEGTRRTLSGTLTLDSRRLMRRAGADYPL